MPDSFNTPDTGRMPDGAPQDWGAAFAALPLATPSDDGWSRIVHSLDAPTRRSHRAYRERRTGWLIGLAGAAVLVMAAWSPLSHWLQGKSSTGTSSAIAAAVTAGSRDVVAPVKASTSTTPDATLAVDTVVKPAPASNPDRDGDATAETRAARARAVRKTAPPAAHLAMQPAQARPREAPPTTIDGPAATAPVIAAIQSLQAQSARLEALVEIARDERVGNASSELLSAELDAGIASVDTSLSNEDLEDSRRQQLWQQRVELLQQLAGVESTARWLAAQGLSNETALVSVD
ncbi:hypothetical protein [Lysobacter tyrosinilyticus]